jgi:hypothetical protein
MIRKHPFIVGEQYFDRQAEYTVTAIQGNVLHFRYDNGTAGQCEIYTKARIHQNILAEQRKIHPFQSEQYFATLGFLARHGHFSSTVPAWATESFEHRYQELTGLKPEVGQGYYQDHSEETADKWWFSTDITWKPDFPVNVPPCNIVHDPGGRKTIHKNSFWWSLINIGFRLGRGHNTNQIRESIPTQFRSAFDGGLSL